jgi:hydrogenase-4 component C
MPSIASFTMGLLQAFALLAVAPLIVGLGRVIAAKLQCRRGPGFFREYADIVNLLKRQEILPLGAGRVFLYVPYVMLATLLLIASALPVLTTSSPIPAVGNLVTDLGAISTVFAGGMIPSPAAGVTAALAFAVACYFEMGKAPFDMAEAEQELQEGPLIEYSGAGLALFKLCLGFRQVVLAAILIGVFLPFGAAVEPSLPALALAIVVFAIKLAAVFVVVGVIANSTARARFLFVSRSTWAGFAVAALALALYAVQITEGGR